MSQTGYSRRPCAGFTLFELLIVMSILAVVALALAAFFEPTSSGVKAKTAALLAASRLRDLRAAAMMTGQERLALVDVDRRVIGFSDGHAPLAFSNEFQLSVTGADSEFRSSKIAGIRFYPNGSSSGATIHIGSGDQRYEIRVNWLTGRISTTFSG